MWRYIKRVLIGKPLKTLDEGQTHLTKFKALAMLSSDAISSVAYGPEQITTVLVTLSAMAMWYSIPIAAIVLLLLLAITLSYQQIIRAYPSGGGAYVVATRNWGSRSEEHTSELQSRFDLVCRLLLEKKKINYTYT